MNDNELKQIKLFLIEELKKIYSAPTISLWFEPLKIVSLDSNAITVSLPENRKAFVEAQYYDVIKLKLNEILGFEVKLKLISDEEEAVNALEALLQRDVY